MKLVYYGKHNNLVFSPSELFFLEIYGPPQFVRVMLHDNFRTSKEGDILV
jgi:hypothetical protein